MVENPLDSKPLDVLLENALREAGDVPEDYKFRSMDELIEEAGGLGITPDDAPKKIDKN